MLIDLKIIKDKKTNILLSSSITKPDDFAGILRAILQAGDPVDQDREHFWVVGLNNANKVLFIDLISLGDRSQALASPPEIFRQAVLGGATSIICGHNHPSGDPTPSDNDSKLMSRILTAGDLLGIKILDHIIVTKDKFYSYGAHRLIFPLMVAGCTTDYNKTPTLSGNKTDTGAPGEEEFTDWEKELHEEKSNFKDLDNADKRQFCHETACLLNFLQDATEAMYLVRDKMETSADVQFGQFLIFKTIEKRIRACEGAFE